MHPVVRPLELPRDRDEWLRLRLALWPEAGRENLSSELNDFAASQKNAVFVAALDNRLAGFVEASLRDYADGCDTSPVGYVEGWYVDPDARLTGVGRALVAAAENWARGRGCTEMASDTHLENVASQHAHEAIGYAPVEKLVVFRKVL